MIAQADPMTLTQYQPLVGTAEGRPLSVRPVVYGRPTVDPDLGPVNRRFPNVRIEAIMAREDEIMAALARSDRRRA
jgi:hypothetical protein